MPNRLLQLPQRSLLGVLTSGKRSISGPVMNLRVGLTRINTWVESGL